MESILLDDKKQYSVFNLLAYICSMIPQEEEYNVVEGWNASSYDTRMGVIKDYLNLLQVIEHAVSHHYNIDPNQKSIIVDALDRFQREPYDVIYLLALSIEERIGEFEHYYQNSANYSGGIRKVIKLPPLNDNWEKTNLKLYPRILGILDRKKADRTRELGFNGVFKYYDCFWIDQKCPFRVTYYLWKDFSLQEKLVHKKAVKIAVSPITNHAVLQRTDMKMPTGTVIKIDGIENKEQIQTRVLNILETIWDFDYDLIMFPEVIGSEELVNAIKDFLTYHPIHNTLILAPTYYSNGFNQAVLLGPGGITLLRQNKLTAFVMHNGEDKQKESLVPCRDINILLVPGVGSMVFPICADLVEPTYSNLIYNVYRPDMILCPSYSVGSGAFTNTMLKGIAQESFGIWLNTCAAREISPKYNYGFRYIGNLQLPHLSDTDKRLKEIVRDCNGVCANCCYFDIQIELKNRKMILQKIKHMIS